MFIWRLIAILKTIDLEVFILDEATKEQMVSTQPSGDHVMRKPNLQSTWKVSEARTGEEGNDDEEKGEEDGFEQL